MSAAYPDLSLFCANGTPIPKAKLFIRKQGAGEQQEYLTYEFEHLLVKAVHTVGSGPSTTMTIVLSYQTIVQEYKPQKDDQTLGSAVKTGWNLKKNAKHG
jgi:type VI secretion system secreted protein Hcp